MYVIDDFRKPFLPKQTRDGLCLFQIEHEPVTIIVVSGVVMIEFRRVATFGGRAQGLAIVIGHYVHAVGIGRRNQNQDRVVQNRERVFVVGARQIVSELHRHLGSDNLSRMNRAGNDDNRLAFTNQLIAFGIARHLARISQPRLNCFILFQIADILGRADEGGDHRPAER